MTFKEFTAAEMNAMTDDQRNAAHAEILREAAALQAVHDARRAKQFEAEQARRAQQERAASAPVTSNRTGFVTPGLLKFLKEHGSDFEAAQFMEDNEPESVRRRQNDDRLDFKCPNEDDSHSVPRPDDTAFCVENASARDNGFWMHCMHAGCIDASGGDRAWFLDKACQNYGIRHADELLEWCPNAPKVVGEPTSARGKVVKTSQWPSPALDLTSTQFSDPDAVFSDRLRAYNEKYAFVVWGKDSVIVKLNSGGAPIDVLRLETFYNRHKNDIVFVSSRGASKPREMAREWMKWEYRATYDGVGFSPANNLAPGMLNFWRGYAVEPAPGDWSHLLRHIFVVTCRENPVYFAATMSFLADIVQRPEERHNTSVVTIGMPGSGKTTPPWFFSLLMPNNRALISKSNLLTGKFNAPLEHALFVHLEEAVWAGDRAAEGVLKSLISEPYHMIERKNLDAQMVPNYARLWMNSNNEWVVPVRPGDRRFLVLRGLDAYATAIASDAERRAHFDPMYAQMQSRGGLAAMLYDLKNIRQPDWIDLRSPIKTPWLDEQREATMETYEAWLYQLLQDGIITSDNGSDFEFGEDGQAGLSVPKVSVRWSLRAFAHDSRRGKGIDEAALGKFLLKFGVKGRRPRGGGSRTQCYEFPALEIMRERFSSAYGVKFDVGGGDEADVPKDAHLSNDEFRSLSTDGIKTSEIEKWRAYGEGKGELP